jgi:hypothetical protein
VAAKIVKCIWRRTRTINGIALVDIIIVFVGGVPIMGDVAPCVLSGEAVEGVYGAFNIHFLCEILEGGEIIAVYVLE